MFSSQNSQVSNDALFVEDVFSDYLYSGTSASNTINNGVDASGKGALVWIKDRGAASTPHMWFDTTRGVGKYIQSNSTGSQGNIADTLTAFNTNGFTLGADSFGVCNASGHNYVSWMFREAPKFFDVVTYTGNGVAGTQIPHSLGSTPGCIMVKRYAGAGGAVDWAVWHNQLGGSEYLKLNTTDAGITNAAYPPFGAVTSTYFTVGNASATGNNGITNSNGDSFVAYVFAHNAGGFGLTGTDNVISCGFFMTDASANASVTLGYEPQWVLIKRIDGVGYWDMLDNMRGMTVGTSNAFLWANTSDAEMVGQRAQPFATGFNYNGSNSASYIYIAIRRGPMKVPTSGTSVFKPIAYTGTGSATTTTSGFVSDLAIIKSRGTYSPSFEDRLRGANKVLQSNGTGAEVSTADYVLGFDVQNGVRIGADGGVNGSGTSYINWMFARAPSFFDEVCYTGNGTSGRTVAHNLAVAPELMIVKSRSIGGTFYDWAVYSKQVGATKYLWLNSTNLANVNNEYWQDTDPTSSVFSLGNGSRVNSSGQTYVAYLFASCAGVSKVGSYTGTGATQTIDCGFTGGARFVLIKRTDGLGSWNVWDTARGMVSGTDPFLSLNLTSAETNTDAIYTTTGGFQIVSTGSQINASGGTYIYLAIA